MRALRSARSGRAKRRWIDDKRFTLSDIALLPRGAWRMHWGSGMSAESETSAGPRMAILSPRPAMEQPAAGVVAAPRLRPGAVAAGCLRRLSLAAVAEKPVVLVLSLACIAT